VVAIGPAVLPFTVFFAVFPLSFVRLSVLVLHSAVALHLIVHELTLKNATALHQGTLAVSSIVDKLTIIASVVWINCLTTTIVHVVFPLPIVFVTCSIEVFS